ncbi:HEAT repeat domain-containing protein [Dyella jejuensis]|uniref:HEAT repeat domain-containing protein n=1 Tax=Dyella jejuensis TaxID=1432009 RepID=A0ABW8JID8_9GAMM
MTAPISKKLGIQDFHTTIESKIDCDNPYDPSWIFSCKATLCDLCDSGAIEQFINKSLKHLISGPKADDPRWLDTGVTLTSGKTWTLRLTIYDNQASGIYSFPHVGLIRNLGDVAYSYLLYELPKNYINDQFQKEAQLGQSHTIEMPPKGLACIDGRMHALDVSVNRPSATLRLYAHLPLTLQWKFNRKSLKAEEAFAGQIDSSELVSLTSAIGAIGGACSSLLLEELAQHPVHFVRWSAIKNLARLSPTKAIELIRAALVDVHPDVRNAAKRSIANIDKAVS